jgi:tetratricopeptide (TPR) repeat protein
MILLAASPDEPRWYPTNPNTPVSDSPPTLVSSPENPAVALLAAGKLEEALHSASEVLAACRSEASQNPAALPSVFAALQVMGDVQRELGDVAAAEATYGEALEVAAKTAIPLDEIARMRTQLATLLDFSEREALAAPLYEQAISDYEALQPPDEIAAAQIRNNLAMIYKGLGKFALAEQHYLCSLEALEQNMGRDSEEVASVYNNLGSLYYTAGFPDQAKEMFGEGLSIREKILGENHADVAQSLCNIATAKHELGENNAALLDFERSLRILELYVKDKAASYEAVGLDYISLLENLGDERKAAAFRKRLTKVLATM